MHIGLSTSQSHTKYYKLLFSRNGRTMKICCTVLNSVYSEQEHKLSVHNTGNFTVSFTEKTLLTYTETPWNRD